MKRFFKSGRIHLFLIVLIVILIGAAAYFFGVRRDMTDFGVCYRAGGRILTAETLYRETDGHLQFKYAPAAALAYAPFSVLPVEAAKILWFIVMVACLAGIMLILFRWAKGRGSAAGPALIWTLVVFLKYLGREFELGQVNLLILLLMVLTLRDWTAGREVRAGIFWGLSLLFKPYALILFPYMILRKKGKTITVGAATLGAGLLVPAAVFGWEGNGTVLGEWIRSLATSTPGLLKVGDNASLFAFIAKTFGFSSSAGPMIIGGILAAALGLLFLAMVFPDRKTTTVPAEFFEGSVLSMLVPMLSPLGWNYNYLYGLPAVFIALTLIGRFTRTEKAVQIVNFILIGGTLREVLGKTAFRFYTFQSLIVPSFLLLFVMLFVARRRRFI